MLIYLEKKKKSIWTIPDRNSVSFDYAWRRFIDACSSPHTFALEVRNIHRGMKWNGRRHQKIFFILYYERWAPHDQKPMMLYVPIQNHFDINLPAEEKTTQSESSQIFLINFVSFPAPPLMCRGDCRSFVRFSFVRWQKIKELQSGIARVDEKWPGQFCGSLFIHRGGLPETLRVYKTSYAIYLETRETANERITDTECVFIFVRSFLHFFYFIFLFTNSLEEMED